MIELKNLSIANDPGHPLLSDVSLTLPAATLTALIGRNGCGKSTLLRTLSGLQKPRAGSVFIDGRDCFRTPPLMLSRMVAAVSTEIVRIDNLTCREMVGMARSPYTGLFGRLSDEDRRIVDSALASVGMESFASRPVARLSDGEARRIMIARALAQSTPVILLDEPTGFLDVPGRYEICALLGRLAREQKKTIVFSTHELEPAFARADAVALIHDCGLLVLPPGQMSGQPVFRQLFTPSGR